MRASRRRRRVWQRWCVYCGSWFAGRGLTCERCRDLPALDPWYSA